MRFWRAWLFCFVVIWACTLTAWAEDGPWVIVREGQPLAVIVTPDKPPKQIQDAAQACRRIVKEMSGAELPIVAEGKYDGKAGVAILVGQSRLAEKLGAKVEQGVETPDHYLIRTIEDGNQQYVALVGNDAMQLRGSAFAVYDLFWRLGCGWYGPDELWQVIPKQQTIAVPALAVLETPAFLKRGLWIRQTDTSIIADAWRWGGHDLANGHNMIHLVPPAKYPQVYEEGVKGGSHPSLTHPDTISAVVKSCREILNKSDASPGYRVRISLSLDDHDHFYDAPGAPKVGNRSAQLLYLCNGVARELQKSHPNRFLLGTLAYWVTHAPPDIDMKAEPGVSIMIVNEGNHPKPLEYPLPPEQRHPSRDNTREVAHLEGWAKTGGLEGVYEWWLPGIEGNIWGKLPWFGMYAASENLKFWHRHHIQYLTYEAWAETEDDFFALRWPMYFVASRCQWDVELTDEEIMTTACKQLFGPAWEEMLHYYQAGEKAMLDCPQPSGNWSLPDPTLVYTPKYESLMDEHLKRAAELAAESKDEKIQARIANQQKFWQQAKRILADRRS